MVNGYRPSTIIEALQIRRNCDVVPYAGGTDWMIKRDESKTLLFLNGIQQLKEVEEDEDGIYIGSACTSAELLKSDMVPQVLKEAIEGIASPAIRNAGTIGGNICNASPAGDTLPILYALDAELVISTVDSTEVVGIEDFIIGPKKNNLSKDELIEQIMIPKNGAYSYYYKKIGARKADAISKLSFVGIFLEEKGVIKKVACAFGAVGPTVVRSKEIEAMLVGKTLKEANVIKDEVISKYSELIHPIDDQRSTAIYRKKVALNLYQDFLESNGI